LEPDVPDALKVPAAIEDIIQRFDSSTDAVDEMALSEHIGKARNGLTEPSEAERAGACRPDCPEVRFRGIPTLIFLVHGHCCEYRLRLSRTSFAQELRPSRAQAVSPIFRASLVQTG
jgi:hypothetical protein